jgi:transcriptional regulator with XRE-family HTH domain
MGLPQEFGIIIKELRINKQLSQEKLADLCELDRTYISMIERGLRQPTLKTIFTLANTLKIKPSLLIAILEEKINYEVIKL